MLEVTLHLKIALFDRTYFWGPWGYLGVYRVTFSLPLYICWLFFCGGRYRRDAIRRPCSPGSLQMVPPEDRLEQGAEQQPLKHSAGSSAGSGEKVGWDPVP